MLLQQKVVALMMQFKQDAQRAGYDGIEGKRITLHGESSIIVSQSSPSSLAYSYRIAPSGEKAFRNIAYRYQSTTKPARLKYCEKTSAAPLTFQQAITSGVSGVCYSLFDSNIISVDSFVVSSDKIANTDWVSQYLHVTATVSLIAEPNRSASGAIQLLLRN
ncbi:hypothetical protein M9194_21090 [Vibrio sp. S4M6]|uniref:hypothetical protein n=2 Tax=Vibrio sinus TaxID=2946865 RepID=UPI00202AA8EB|nr:hypothetical protein [Vibrio sinus]MCL9783919.1 hypothetical protein [Vibrio sinus]